MKFRVSDIPEEFAYLREATRRYGHLSHHEVILEFLEKKTEADLDILRGVAAEMESKGHERAISDWIRAAQARDERIGDAVSDLFSLMWEIGILKSPDYGAMPREVAREKLKKKWEDPDPVGLCGLADETLKVFTPAEGRAFVMRALRKLSRKDKVNAVMALFSFPVRANVGLIERFWTKQKQTRKPNLAWGQLAALSGVDWATLCAWLASAGPLRKVALDALDTFCFDECVPGNRPRPTMAGRPTGEEMRRYLAQLGALVDDAQVKRRVNRLVRKM